jgi:hypothetical protein
MGGPIGPWKLPRKLRVTCLESMNRSKALSSLWVGHRPMETPSKDAPNLFRITEPQQRVFHSHGWAAGPCELRRKSRVTCLESMDLINVLSSLWVGHGPMGTQNLVNECFYSDFSPRREETKLNTKSPIPFSCGLAEKGRSELMSGRCCLSHAPNGNCGGSESSRAPLSRGSLWENHL